MQVFGLTPCTPAPYFYIVAETVLPQTSTINGLPKL